MLNKFNSLYQQIILESRKDSYIEQLNNKNIDNANDLAEYIFAFNNPKKEKVALYWLLKGSIRLPEDQDKVDKAFNLIEKQHLNYQEFDNPMSIINRGNKSTQRINAQDQSFNPDKEPAFKNKKELGDGVVVYQVSNALNGLVAVRKAIDVNWGYDKNPWCLAARINDKLDQASIYWYRYNAYPKRIAFKNGKLLAFCANDTDELLWWNKNDVPTKNIPETNVEDDIDFLLEYIPMAILDNPNCSTKLLKILSTDQDWRIRLAVVQHLNCPIELLEILSNDPNERVRCGIAERTKTPKHILLKLSKDKIGYVRKAIIENPKCTQEMFDNAYWTSFK